MSGEDATPFSSGIPRYSVNVCDWCHMPLEPCPTCGYALSIVDHHCRHCATASRAIPSRPSNAKYLQPMIMAVVALSVLVYLIFFR
jgi:predicted amidophosphoribosyltransferase